ncbi:MAG: hypothetical protein ACK5N8_08895 [Alphaproteobacteria bacterium]
MNVLEKFVKGKSENQNICEDGLFVSDNFIAVVDGATAKSDRLFGGKRSGKVAMETILSALSMLPKEIECIQAFEQITKSLSDFYRQHQIFTEMLENPHQRPTASVIIYSCFHKQIWSVGDCQAWVDGKELKTEKFIDFLMSEMRAYYLASEIKQGKTEAELLEEDSGRMFIAPMLTKQCMFQNNEVKSQYSFIVVDGTKIPEQEIVIYDVSNAKQIVLASDGYTKLFSSLTATEKELERILKADPLCYKENKGTKAIAKGNLSFDDRSYVRFEI